MADTTQQIAALSQVVVFFTLVLALSLLVERLIELVKLAFDYLDYRLGLDKFWSRRAERLNNRLKKKLGFLSRTNPGLEQTVIKQYSDRTLNQAGTYKGTTSIISGDMMRVIFTRVAAKLVGIGIGITLAVCFKIDLFAYTDPEYALAQYQFGFKTILSGMIIGLGAAPVHKIITTIERARKKRQQKAASGS